MHYETRAPFLETLATPILTLKITPILKVKVNLHYLAKFVDVHDSHISDVLCTSVKSAIIIHDEW